MTSVFGKAFKLLYQFFSVCYTYYIVLHAYRGMKRIYCYHHEVVAL